MLDNTSTGPRLLMPLFLGAIQQIGGVHAAHLYSPPKKLIRGPSSNNSTGSSHFEAKKQEERAQIASVCTLHYHLTLAEIDLLCEKGSREWIAAMQTAAKVSRICVGAYLPRTGIPVLQLRRCAIWSHLQRISLFLWQQMRDGFVSRSRT